jgi:5-formyltetrahydrofolate cyclo-ligase
MAARKRMELYAARNAMTAEQRHDAAQKIAVRLDSHCKRDKPALIGLYWPIKYEPNLLSWARAQVKSLRFCLPVVFREDNLLNIGIGRQATQCSQVCGRSRCLPVGRLSRLIW